MYINIKKSKNDKEVLFSAVKIFKNNYDDNKINELLSEKINIKEYRQKKIKNPIKNFIRNNVTKTKEFNYIMRYTNTKDVSTLLYNNTNLVEFLLKNLSETELEKYKSLGVTKESIASVTLDSIIYNLRNGNMDYSINIKVYLKCIYFLIKNMVNINSYYFIAFSFYDRDTELILGKYINKDSKYNLELTEALLPKNDKKQVMKTLENFNEILKESKDFFRYYRNIIDHININKNLFKTRLPENFKYKNYFKIYHYVLQKSLLRTEYNSNFLNECKKDIETYGTYSKNLLYVMNAMFMYNYARYKDISDEIIFLRKYSE